MAAMVKSKGALKLSITHGEEAQLMLIYHVCAQRCRWQQIWALEYLSKRSSLLSLRATDCPIQRAGLTPEAAGQVSLRRHLGRPPLVFAAAKPNRDGTLSRPGY